MVTMEPSKPGVEPPRMPTQEEMRREVARNRGWFIALGGLLVIGGLLAVAFPFISTLSASIAIGLLLAVAGAAQVVHAFSVRGWGGKIWSVVVGLLWVVAGGVIAFFPLVGALSLTVLLAAAFLIEGIVEIVWGVRSRNERGWGWIVASGVIAVLAGLLIGLGLPVSSLFAVGLLVGLNMVVSGASFLGLAVSVGGDRKPTMEEPA